MRIMYCVGYIIGTLLLLYLPWIPLLIFYIVTFIPGLILKLGHKVPDESAELSSVCPPVVKHDIERHSGHVVISGHSFNAPAHLIPK
jgi:hypothetical protein